MPFTSSAGSRGESVPVSRHAGLALALVLAAAVVTPLSLRALNRAAVGVPPGLGYLPALELSREHREFNPQPIANLSYGQPAWVFIGDSMMGTRVDPVYLGEISARHDEIVAFLFHPATGPAWWYLAFKNHLVPSGVKPRAVFVFFRDTNLTDTLFRLESLYGNALDEVAHAQEPELNALVAARKRGVWSRVHTAGGARLPDRRRHRLDGTGAAPLVRQLALSRHLGAAALRPAPQRALRSRQPAQRRRRRSVGGQRGRPTSPATCRRRCCRR